LETAYLSLDHPATSRLYRLSLHDALPISELGVWLRSGEYVFIAILGGAGHAVGAFLGALVFEAVKLTSSAYFPGLWQFILGFTRSEEHTSELQSRENLVCRLLLEKKKQDT